ncbi:MAG: DUF1415 domain-containing protein [Vitreoscilla sp.]|nr:DUF1415 domain-containing protein [Polaromonas sp.]
MTDDQVLTQTRHWLEKAVIGLNLCPFAKAVYVKNQVRLVVSKARHADDLLEELDLELNLLVATPASEIDTTLLIVPALFADFLDFNDFLEIAEDVIDEHQLEGVIQLASFHPQFQFDGTSANDISNYTNRAPFACLHLLREDSVTRAVEAFPEADAIFKVNITTLEKLGHAAWTALMQPTQNR